MSRLIEERKLVPDGGAPRCPACSMQLSFQSDRQGQTVAQCGCGYRAYIVRRTGKVGVNVAGP